MLATGQRHTASMAYARAQSCGNDPFLVADCFIQHRALIMVYHTHVYQYVHAPDLLSCLHDMLFRENRHNVTVVGTQLTVPTVTWAGRLCNSPLLFNRLHNDK
jgi:hypothetical protein